MSTSITPERKQRRRWSAAPGTEFTLSTAQAKHLLVDLGLPLALGTSDIPKAAPRKP